MQTIEVENIYGKFKIRKPNARERNDALEEAETKPGKIKQTIFVDRLLPKVIIEHPFGAKPISEALDSMESDEYDKLSLAMVDLIRPKKDGDELGKKSKEPSQQKDFPSKDGSKTNL